MTRLNILPAPAFQDLQSELSELLAQVGARVRAEQFGSLLDPLLTDIFRHGVAQAGADEGTLWLVDESEEFLVPAFNSGPRAHEIVGQFKQPLKSGLICLVFASEQPFLENDVAQNRDQSKLLDTLLKVETAALIAVPFYFLRQCRGVISCVQLAAPGPPPRNAGGFRAQHLACIQQTAEVLSRLIDFQLVSSTVGWNR